MVKKVNANIMTRLENRFDLSQIQGSPLVPFVLNEVVAPITNVDDLLKVPKAGTSTESISGTGNTTMFTVPAGKRWVVKHIFAGRETGTFNHNLEVDIGGVACQLADAVASGSIIYASTNLLMDEGDFIFVNCNSHTTTGNLRSEIVYTEEDAY